MSATRLPARSEHKAAPAAHPYPAAGSRRHASHAARRRPVSR